jgi:hypothetical protein
MNRHPRTKRLTSRQGTGRACQFGTSGINPDLTYAVGEFSAAVNF